MCRVVDAPSDAHLAVFLARLDEILKRPGPSAVIFDLSAAPPPPAAHRRAMAGWLKQNAAELRATLAGIAFVFVSPVFRFVLSTVFLLQPLPCPHVVCSSQDDARAWAQKRLLQFKPR